MNPNKLEGLEKLNYYQSLSGEDKYKALNEIIGKSKKILFFGGAGVSTESGIPDFRSQCGLYHVKDDRFKEYAPEYLLSRMCLLEEPEVFFDFYKNKLDCRLAVPNATHKKLAELERAGKLLGVVTQNIDGLHQKAGSKKVYEIHGTTLRNYCMNCGKEYSSDYIFDSKELIPRCKECGGIVRPDVTLYGEALPDSFVTALKLFNKADCLIIGGTSLTVKPASNLLYEYYGKYLIIINRDETFADKWADLVFRESIGEVFNRIKA